MNGHAQQQQPPPRGALAAPAPPPPRAAAPAAVVLDLTHDPIHVDTAPAYHRGGPEGDLAHVRWTLASGAAIRFDGRPDDLVRLLRFAANDLEAIQQAVDQAAARRLRRLWRVRAGAPPDA